MTAPHVHKSKPRKRRFAHRAGVRIVASLLLGGLGGWAFSPFAQHVVQSVMVGWIVTALVFCVWTVAVVGRMDHNETAEFAVQEDSSVVFSDMAVIVGILASLVGVGFLLAAGAKKNSSGTSEAVIGTLSVVASWFLVHIMYALRYARTYYGSGKGERGIEYDGGEPDYWDFAYVAFDLGMTYQISDTTLKSRHMRRIVLGHTLLSYLLGVGVIATTINLVTSLASN